MNKIAGVLKFAPDKIDADCRGKTADNDEWDWIFQNFLNQCGSGKTRKFGPPPPYAPIVCRRFEPPFWFEIIISLLSRGVERKINFINEVLLLRNPYILMKSSAYSPLL